MVPAPVTVMPAPVPMHLLWLELGDFLATGDCGMSIRIVLRHAAIAERLRRQWRGLCGGTKRDGSSRDTEGKFQEVPTLHGVSSA